MGERRKGEKQETGGNRKGGEGEKGARGEKKERMTKGRDIISLTSITTKTAAKIPIIKR